MSYYSSQDIKNELVEPSIHNGSGSGARSEFRLQGSFIPNIKLLNNGRFGNAGGTMIDLVGQLGNIKHISLMDGQTVITQVRNFNDVMGFKNLLNSNHKNSDVDRFTNRNQIGYQSRYFNNKDNYNRKTMLKNNISNSFSATDDDASTNPRAYYSLAECLKMLQVVPVLSSKVFSQLRLVIEYEDNSVNGRAKCQTQTNLSTENCRPLIAVDRVVDPVVEKSLLDSLSNLSWFEEEHDRVVIEAGTAGQTQNKKRKVLGFNNKVVDKIRIRTGFNNKASNLNGNDVVGYGEYRSLSGNNVKFQLSVNGRPLFSRLQEGANRRLAHLVDTHGDLNLSDGANMHFDTNNVALSLNGNEDKNGCLDYFGSSLGLQRVNELQIEYQRDCLAGGDSKYLDELELFITCEVQKNLTLNNGKYLVGY
jgi:hypothetical protein